MNDPGLLQLVRLTYARDPGLSPLDRTIDHESSFVPPAELQIRETAP